MFFDCFGMKNRYYPLRIGRAALMVALVFVIISVLFTNHLSRLLADEESHKMEIWAEATRQLIQAEENTNIDLISSIIEGNTTIPVYMLDAEGNVLLTRNVKHAVADPTKLFGPIEVYLDENTVQYIYYDESVPLRQLRVMPYIEFGIILLFVFIAVITIYIGQRSEQNRVWVGLSKETAHQLGTPISSLMAWHELLVSRYPEDELIPQMQLDIKRLEAIAERFSKIGSEPELHVEPLLPLVRATFAYMRARTSSRINMTMTVADEHTEHVLTNLCAPLFQWVLENLMKNAVDAMDGEGSLSLSLKQEGGHILIDVTDTGRGIERGLYKRIFQPGYTSKARGWGLGLSLSKRIIEDYHRGKIFVLQSVVGAGTTFRIILEEAEDGTAAA